MESGTNSYPSFETLDKDDPEAIKDFFRQLIKITDQETLDWIEAEIIADNETNGAEDDFFPAETLVRLAEVAYKLATNDSSEGETALPIAIVDQENEQRRFENLIKAHKKTEESGDIRKGLAVKRLLFYEALSGADGTLLENFIDNPFEALERPSGFDAVTIATTITQFHDLKLRFETAIRKKKNRPVDAGGFDKKVLWGKLQIRAATKGVYLGNQYEDPNDEKQNPVTEIEDPTEDKLAKLFEDN